MIERVKLVLAFFVGLLSTSLILELFFTTSNQSKEIVQSISERIEYHHYVGLRKLTIDFSGNASLISLSADSNVTSNLRMTNETASYPAIAQLPWKYGENNTFFTHANYHYGRNGRHYQRFKTRIVVFIPTKISSKKRRIPVNRQFAKENWSSSDVVIIWIIGTKSGKVLEKELDYAHIYEEPFMNVQNVVVTNCRDDGDEWNNENGTSSTTCKFYEAQRYMYQHFDAEYAIRGADDAYLNIRKFWEIEPSLPRNAMWLGHKRQVNTPPLDLSLNKQPRIQKLFGLDQFSVNYMLGMGFVFSWDIVQLIATWNIPPHLTWCEDVMIGMYLNIFQINRIHRPDLFVNRAGSIADQKYYYGTLGKLDVILLHYIDSRDWATIDANGSIYIKKYW